MKLKADTWTQAELAQRPTSNELYPEYYQIVKSYNKNQSARATMIFGLPGGWSLLKLGEESPVSTGQRAG
jgi:hypothetical protein